MNTTLGRIALGATLGAGMTAAGLGALPAGAQSCDPAYVSHCVPPLAETGDLNCEWFYAQGISMIQLADPATDPHGLDGWNYVDDGWGCEGEGY